jgi:hypothetical protein
MALRFSQAFKRLTGAWLSARRRCPALAVGRNPHIIREFVWTGAGLRMTAAPAYLDVPWVCAMAAEGNLLLRNQAHLAL